MGTALPSPCIYFSLILFWKEEKSNQPWSIEGVLFHEWHLIHRNKNKDVTIALVLMDAKGGERP